VLRARRSDQSAIGCRAIGKPKSSILNPQSAMRSPPLAGFFIYHAGFVLIAAVRSVATYVAVSIYVLFAAPLGMLLAAIFRWKGILYILGHGGVRLALALSGIHVRVAGREHIPVDRAAVYCANHQSNVDPPILFDALHPRMHIVFKAEINAIPLLARAFRHGGFIPIERSNKESAMRSLEAGAQSIRSGNSFLIFPEGTRSKTAELLPFKKGGFVMAMKAGAPIVPVAVSGGRDAMQRGSRIIQPVRFSIRVGEPIETTGLQLADRDALIARVRERIEALVAMGPVID
jgi:1-acyl-sn-glycerol-3-phosphate acyltransferase